MSYSPGRCESCGEKFWSLVKTMKFWKDSAPTERLLCKDCFLQDR